MVNDSTPVLAYKAIGKYFSESAPCAATPRAAAQSFFALHPDKRKCAVQEGVLEQGFFRVTYSLVAGSSKPRVFEGVTRKTILQLPDGDPSAPSPLMTP